MTNRWLKRSKCLITNIKNDMNGKILTSVLSVAVFFAGVSFVLAETYNAGASVDISAGASVGGSAKSARSATGTSLKAEVKAQAEVTRLTRGKDRANQEIDRRIEGLNKLIDKVRSMKRLTDADKTSLAATVEAEIANLANLKTKIAADTELTVLKTDIKSITQSYRIYALVIPRGHILAAADRIIAIADSMTALGVKLDVRLAEAGAAGKDAVGLQTVLDDYRAKIAAAKVEATAAVTATASLSADQGDEAKFQANKKVLADARAKIKAGSENLKAARQDVRTFIQTLKSLDLEVKAHGEVTATSTAETP